MFHWQLGGLPPDPWPFDLCDLAGCPVSPATLDEHEGVMIDDQQFVNVVSFWCSWAAA